MLDFSSFASSAPPLLPTAAASSSSSRPPRFDRSFVRSVLRTFPFSLRVSFAFAVAAIAILIVLFARHRPLALFLSLRYFVFSFRRFSLADSFVVTSGLFLWIRAFVSLSRRDSARLEAQRDSTVSSHPCRSILLFLFSSFARSFVRSPLALLLRSLILYRLRRFRCSPLNRDSSAYVRAFLCFISSSSPSSARSFALWVFSLSFFFRSDA